MRERPSIAQLMDPRMAPILRSALVALGLGCLGPAEPIIPAETVLVGFSGTDSVSVHLEAVDLLRGNVVPAVNSLPHYQDAWARSPDGRTLYVSAFDQIPTRELIAIDAASLRTIWQEPVATIAGRSHIGSISITANYALSPSFDGTRLFVADAVRGSVLGFAALDAATHDPVNFFGPVAAAPSSVVTLPPTPGAPGGTIVIAGSRDDTLPTAPQLLVLDALTLAVRDSATVGAEVAARRGGVSQLVTSPDHRCVYVVGRDTLYRYDLAARVVTATARRLGTGRLAPSPDGERLYLADAGDGRDSPGSGRIFVYDSGLNSLAPIDLSPAAVNGVPPVTVDLAVSGDDGRLYVASGTAYIGPLFGAQPGRVLALDLGTSRFVREISLNEYGLQWLLLR